MADSKRTLPAIAIGLAIVAVIMVGLAIRTRMHDLEPVPVKAARPDAALPVDPPPPPPPDVPAQAGSGCMPCSDASCRTSCTCRDGTFKTSFRCLNGCCEQANCDDSCAQHGGPR